MEQLVMKAAAPYTGRMGVLPEGYRFVTFDGSAEDVADWKRIIMEPPSPPDGSDSCYHLMIEIYPDVVPEKDIHFIENVAGERVGTITHKDGSGYVHMVKAMQTERRRSGSMTMSSVIFLGSDCLQHGKCCLRITLWKTAMRCLSMI